MEKKEVEVFYPASPAEFRKWLKKNHLSKESVWLVFYNKASGKNSLSWSEAVDVALCFGWIDSKKIKIDADTAHQFFSKRKPKSTWSKINKAKVLKLIESGLMTEAGLKSIETAKQNGSWTILDDVEELIIPEDLCKELDNHPAARDFFFSLSKSVKKIILHWLKFAKRPETRQKRLKEVVEFGEKKMKPRHLQ